MSVDSTVSSSIEIQPPSLYPTPVNRDVFKALNKKIDYAMGLLLPDEDIEYLERGTYSMSPAISSINQTDGFTRFIPMFLNVEVKRQDPNSDAKVQLAVWITAEFKKRAEEGYDRNMPVLAVAVYGDDWSLWIAYEPSPEKGSPVQKIVRHILRSLQSKHANTSYRVSWDRFRWEVLRLCTVSSQSCAISWRLWTGAEQSITGGSERAYCSFIVQ